MRRTGFLVSACALALVFGTTGCDDTRDGDDSGTIMLMDSGPPPTDTGTPTPTDTGPPPTGSCAISGLMALPTACLPRCSNATASAVMACMDGTCLQAALDADTTPPTPIMTPDPSLTSLDCGGCYSLQVSSCAAEVCPTEFNAFAMCPMGSDCTAQETALDMCLETNNMAFQNCGGPRVSACFGATSGFLPAAPRTFELPAHVMSFMARYDFAR